jgi:hypothetical protein
MNDLIQPEPWSDSFGIWCWYVLCFGLYAHLLFFFLGCLLIAIVLGLILTIRGKTSIIVNRIGQWIGRWTVFMIILLMVSGGFDILWQCMIWGNLYVTGGADCEADFNPFISIDLDIIHEKYGKLLRGTIDQLHSVWLFFAAMSWIISYIFYRLIYPVIIIIKNKVISMSQVIPYPKEGPDT